MYIPVVPERGSVRLRCDDVKFGVVVQLVRIPACHAGGRGFESRPLRQSESPFKQNLYGLFLSLKYDAQKGKDMQKSRISKLFDA